MPKVKLTGVHNVQDRVSKHNYAKKLLLVLHSRQLYNYKTFMYILRVMLLG